MALRDRIPFMGADPATRPAGGRSPTPTDGMLGHTPPAPTAEQIPRPRAGAVPLGQSGRANFYGLPEIEERNRELAGPEGLRRFDEMYRTDGHVRRLVLAAWSPLVAGTWTLEPYGGDDATDEDREIARHIWWMLTEWMSPNFTEHLLEVGPLLLRSGFLACEKLWDTVTHDGRLLLGPRSLQIRLPRSIWRWWQDDYGQLTHIGQILPNRADVIIPATNLVYYRVAPEGDNWMGTSLLRHAYKHWLMKDRLERIDVIGQERKAVGVPVVYPPKNADKQTKDSLELLLMNLHLSEVAYLMMPGPKAGSQGGNAIPQDEWLLDVIKFDSSSGSGILESIDYHQRAMSASFLEDFLELGHHQVGARATAEVQEDPFLTAINGALVPIAVPPLNRLIDEIRRVNWGSAAGSPQLKLTLNDEASLSEIAAYITPLVQAEVIQVDPELEDWVRDRAGMPAANAEVREQRAAARQAGPRQAADQLAGSGETEGQEPPPAAEAAEPTPTAARKPGRRQRHAEALAQLAADNDRRLAQIDREMEELTALDDATPVAAGVIVHAADTGRVLTVQRTPDDTDPDDVFGTLEFPGGKLDQADRSPWQGAVREFTEETGVRLPAGSEPIGQFDAPGGRYRAHVVRIPTETSLDLGHGDRKEIVRAVWRHPDSDAATMSDRARRLLPGLRQVLNRHSVRRLDAPAPLSGATTTADGLQMVPEVAGEACSCRTVDGETVSDGCPVHDHRHLDSAGEPTARWFDRLLSQDRLREAMDGCRDHIEAACRAPTLTLARQLAHQAANGTPMTSAIPPAELVDALTTHYQDMYRLGHETVQSELARQRQAVAGRQLDDPAGDGTLAGGGRLARARARGEHSARNILGAIQERLGRDQITGLKDGAALQAAAERAATGQLRMEAVANTAAQINDGRNDAGSTAPDVIGAVYTSVMDAASCDSCIAADTGDVLPPDQALALGPPNPDCDGQDRCRCTLVWVLSSDPAAIGMA